MARDHAFSGQQGRPDDQGTALTADQTADGWLCELTIEEGSTVDVRPTTAATTLRRASDKGLFPIKLDEYLQLLDTSGRIVRAGKTGAIPDHLAPILARLGVNAALGRVDHTF